MKRRIYIVNKRIIDRSLHRNTDQVAYETFLISAQNVVVVVVVVAVVVVVVVVVIVVVVVVER